MNVVILLKKKFYKWWHYRLILNLYKSGYFRNTNASGINRKTKTIHLGAWGFVWPLMDNLNKSRCAILVKHFGYTLIETRFKTTFLGKEFIY